MRLAATASTGSCGRNHPRTLGRNDIVGHLLQFLSRRNYNVGHLM